MIQRRASIAAGVAFAASVLAACGIPEDRRAAEAYAERYFSAIGGGDVASALPLYSPKFYERTPRDEWLQILRDVRERCGPASAHTLTNWSVMNRLGTDAGSSATLVFDVEYASCRITETLTVFKSDDGERRIVGHYMKPEGPAPGKPRPAVTTA